jgi:hypothetical protein
MRPQAALCCVVLSAAVLAAQTPLGEPRWMPVDPALGPRRTTAGAAMERRLLALVGLVKALPILTPPPGVYPSASLTVDPPDPDAPLAPHRGSVMIGFWPPDMARLRNGRLEPAGELSHLIVYANSVREESFDRTYWTDRDGRFYPAPALLGNVQGFPIYQGSGGTEVSGILVIQPEGRSLFAPVSRERFHRFEVADLERQIATAEPALKAAQAKYAAFTSADGLAARSKQIADSLDQYQKTRPRTTEQIASREKDLRRLDAEEAERLKVDATVDGHRLIGPLTRRLTQARAALDALTAGERSAPACHAPDSRVLGPHPVPPGTAGCQPVVSLAAWDNKKLPRDAWQLLSVERYWPSAEAVRKGASREKGIYYHLNKEVVEALDWKAIAGTLLQ